MAAYSSWAANTIFGSSVWQTTGYIYDPVANAWTFVAPPPGWSNVGDAQSVVLPDGTVMLANILNGQTAILDPVTLTWTSIAGNGKADRNDEEGWTLLPDGTVLTVDAIKAPGTERYIPSLQEWISAGSTPASLEDSSSQEVGPDILGYDGKVLAFGATGNNAIYTPPTTLMGTGSWTAAPSFPIAPSGTIYDVADGPCCVEPDGKILVFASPGIYQSGAQFFEYDGTNLNPIGNTPNCPYDSSYYGGMLLLPSGQVWFTDFSTDVEVLTPATGAQPGWRPTITSYPTTVNPGTTYTISGTQFNGLCSGSAYGDDLQNATNYPLVRISNTLTNHVFYCRTGGHSTMAVATKSLPTSTNFTVPAQIRRRSVHD